VVAGLVCRQLEAGARRQVGAGVRLEQALASGRASAGRTARGCGGRWRRGWWRAREWLGRSRSSLGGV
jgi:hypothetical protein